MPLNSSIIVSALVVALGVTAGCATASGSHIIAPGVSIEVSDGTVTTTYEYPLCLVERQEKGTVSITTEAVPRRSIIGELLAVIAGLFKLL